MQELSKPKATKLSAIVPLTRMAGRMANLETLFAQSTNLPVKILLVHDIQDSDTTIELKHLVKKHKYLDIDVIEGTFGAPGLARNAGLENPLAEWTAFWDADDLPNPKDVLEEISRASADVEVIIGNFTVLSPHGIASIKHEAKIEIVALNPGLWRMIFRSSILESIYFSSTLMGEDQLFLIDLGLGSRKILFSNKFFYQYYRGFPMQLTSTQESVNDVEKTLKSVAARFKKNERLKNSFSEIIFLRLLVTTIVRTNASSRLSSIITHSHFFFQLSCRTVFSCFANLRKIRGSRS